MSLLDEAMATQQLAERVRAQMKEKGDLQWQRNPLPTTFPCFKTAGVAAERLMQGFDCQRWLVMRDQSLRQVREAVLRCGRLLVIPPRADGVPIRIPLHALRNREGQLVQHLVIDPLPAGSEPYCEGVDIVVVGCHAFDPQCERLMALDSGRTASLLDDYADGLAEGFRLGRMVPIICVAADSQQVTGWPKSAQGHRAHMVVTATQTIELPWWQYRDERN